MTDHPAAPPDFRGLDNLAGCPGCVTSWQVLEPPLGWQRPPGAGALLDLPGDHLARAQTLLRAEAPQAVRVEVNGCTGWQVALNGEPLVPGDCSTGLGNHFTGRLQAGDNELAVTLAPLPGPRLLGVRLLQPDRQPLSGVWQSAAALPPPEGAALQSGLSPVQEFNRLAAAPPEMTLDRFASWSHWRAAFSARLEDLLAVPTPAAVAHDECVEVVREEGYRRERHLLHLADGVTILPLWLLAPDQPHGAGVLCLHGHGYRYGETLGLPGEPREAQQALIADTNYDYARQAARRGYLALTPDLRGFGQRRDAEPGARDLCDANFLRLNQFGLHLVAAQLHDLQAVLDWFTRQPQLRPDRLGCLGLSYGGRMTMYLAAIEPRIRVAVVSGACNLFRERLLHNSSCGAQFVPGLLRLGDTPEVLGLIAPRPLIIELGHRDGTSPELMAAEVAHRLQSLYQAAGAGDQLAFDRFEWGHKFSGRLAWDWLEQTLLS